MVGRPLGLDNVYAPRRIPGQNSAKYFKKPQNARYCRIRLFANSLCASTSDPVLCVAIHSRQKQKAQVTYLA